LTYETRKGGKVESLAIIVLILFSIAFFAGPLAILLSAKKLTQGLELKGGSVFKFINLLRKFTLIVLVILAFTTGFQFLTISGLPLIPRATGLFAIVTSYIALRREFFPQKFIVGSLLKKIRGSK
jgi:hypothetical protein